MFWCLIRRLLIISVLFGVGFFLYRLAKIMKNQPTPAPIVENIELPSDTVFYRDFLIDLSYLQRNNLVENVTIKEILDRKNSSGRQLIVGLTKSVPDYSLYYLLFDDERIFRASKSFMVRWPIGFSDGQIGRLGNQIVFYPRTNFSFHAVVLTFSLIIIIIVAPVLVTYSFVDFIGEKRRQHRTAT